MDREPAPFPTRYLIFNDLRLYGFWVSQSYREASAAEIEEMHQTIAESMRDHSISIPRTNCAAATPSTIGEMPWNSPFSRANQEKRYLRWMDNSISKTRKPMGFRAGLDLHVPYPLDR